MPLIKKITFEVKNLPRRKQTGVKLILLKFSYVLWQ